MFLIDTFDSRSTALEKGHTTRPLLLKASEIHYPISPEIQNRNFYISSDLPLFFHRKTDNNHDRMNYLAAVKKRKETDKTEETKQD